MSIVKLVGIYKDELTFKTDSYDDDGEAYMVTFIHYDVKICLNRLKHELGKCFTFDIQWGGKITDIKEVTEGTETKVIL
ncbi:unnamed protein product [marine sediment metagenome]|uniref:Uncharacterized protein n=1 Tax=marine sediment metagenome TaxID=412755 RepID=X1C828_9ZZZZ